ncbi:MAG: mannose-1-phosphate guanylyltransferase [Halobacteriovoraceae bacterium]|nr:mannose-1-phosphate guanylyltransferase [Halobacteriovoraceae bacterium]
MKSYAVIMAGGKGTRFWPESTSQKPKQYLNLTGKGSLLGITLKRFDGMIDSDSRFVVTVKQQEALAGASSHDLIHPQGLIFEPSGRNTAPCILLSMAHLESFGAKEEDVLAIVPSDHVILNEEGFRETMKKSIKLATENESIVTIGIPPHFPHTGYGYIQKGEAMGTDSFKVKEFKEKPDRQTAEKYLSSGQYVWNAGMFVSTLKVLKEEFLRCSPETFSFYPELLKSIGDELKVASVYDRIPKDSIDYAVMEKSQKVSVVPASFDWNDLGSWDALEAVMEQTSENTLVGERGSYISESVGNIVYAPNKYISLIGVNDLIVVSNDKTLVVLPKDRSQDVKNIVEHLKKSEDFSDLL